VIKDEERRPAQREIAMPELMPELMLEEVDEKVMAAKHGKPQPKMECQRWCGSSSGQ
jgi:hypothetical protein